MMKQSQNGWDPVNKLIVWSCVSLIVVFVGLFLLDQIPANMEAHVRIKHNYDQWFFDYIEKSIKEKRASVRKIEDHRPHPVSAWIDAEDFQYATSRLFILDDYRVIKRRTPDYLVFRGDMPPADVVTEKALRLMSYDPTNGTYSVGYHARIIKD